MRSKTKALALAALALAGAGAHAGITNSNENLGNSSVLFVAMDNATSVSITIDLGVNVADFLQANAAITNGNGALSGLNTTATWNFGTNSRTVNGAAVTGDYGWSTAFASFVSAATSGYTWGIVGADNVTGAISGTNQIFNRNLLVTGTPTQTAVTGLTSSATVSNAAANFQNFVAGSNASANGNHATVAEGANVETSGGAFLNTVMKGTMGGQVPWNYLTAVGSTTNLWLIQQASNPVVYQLGNTYGVDTVSVGNVASFTFDGTILAFAVPEPGTYALMFAGLAAVGAVVRRRRQA